MSDKKQMTNDQIMAFNKKRKEQQAKKPAKKTDKDNG